MLVEHTFITLLDAPEAMGKASDFLTAQGFTRLIGTPEENCIEMQRGKFGSSRGRDITRLPQQVRLEWDRGRVNVAAVLHTTSPDWVARRGTYDSKQSRTGQADLMKAIASGLELLLSGQQDAETARAQWASVEKTIREKARRDRRNSAIVWILFFVILAAMIGGTIFFVSR